MYSTTEVRQNFTAFSQPSMALSILIRHTVKWVATDRQFRSHATPHRGPCYAAIFPVTIVPAAHGFSYTAKMEAKPLRFGKPSIDTTSSFGRCDFNGFGERQS
jgi:hypothetical protein